MKDCIKNLHSTLVPLIPARYSSAYAALYNLHSTLVPLILHSVKNEYSNKGIYILL